MEAQYELEFEPCEAYVVRDGDGIELQAFSFEKDAREYAELTRTHPADVREILRRAGLSMAAELEINELERARKAAEIFPDPRTPAATIRHFIIPPADFEGVTD